MQFKFLTTALFLPLALAAPTPLPTADDIVARPAHALQERQSSSGGGASSSMISSIMSAALPIIEQLMSSMLPTIESMITSALKKREVKRDGSVVYEVEVPRDVAEMMKI